MVEYGGGSWSLRHYAGFSRATGPGFSLPKETTTTNLTTGLPSNTRDWYCHYCTALAGSSRSGSQRSRSPAQPYHLVQGGIQHHMAPKRAAGAGYSGTRPRAYSGRQREHNQTSSPRWRIPASFQVVIRPMRHLTLPGAGLREQVVRRGFIARNRATARAARPDTKGQLPVGRRYDRRRLPCFPNGRLGPVSA
jgi:hypothetical protein